MKKNRLKFKSIFIFALTSIAFTTQVWGQEERKNVIKLGPIECALGMYNLQYERVLSEKVSGLLYLELTSKSINKYLPDSSKVTDLKYSGFAVIPEIRYYLSKKGAPRGFFIGAYAPIRSLNFSGTVIDSIEATGEWGSATPKFKTRMLGLGFILGAQALIGGRVSIEPSLGLGFISWKLPAPTVTLETASGYKETHTLDDEWPDNFEKGYLGPWLRLGFKLGVAF